MQAVSPIEECIEACMDLVAAHDAVRMHCEADEAAASAANLALAAADLLRRGAPIAPSVCRACEISMDECLNTLRRSENRHLRQFRTALVRCAVACRGVG